MKQGWEIKKLGEVCNINYGTRVVQKKDGGTVYPVYGGGGATFKMDRYNREDCLIVSRFAMSSQCVRYVSGKFFLNDSGLTIESYEAELSQSFLDKHIIALNDVIYSLGKGVAQKNLDIKELKQLDIKYPKSREEQERIVEELDCLSGVIEKKREQLKQLDALAQSIFYQMFGDPITNEKGWKVSNLKDVCNKITDGTHDTPERLSNGVKFITGKHIRPGIIDYENSDYVLQDVHNEIYARCNPEFGDVLYTNIGANLGTAAINVVHYEFSMKNVALLKVNKNIINGYYLQSYLNDEEVKNDIINSLSNGGAQKFLSLKMIAKISIPIPPLALQQEFADKIEAIEKQKELIKKSISETETLFNARMDYYFN